MGQRPSSRIDYGYRPHSYFWAEDARIKLASSIKGAGRRALYQASLQENQPPLHPDLARASLTDAERSAWGAVHPSFMGGEYLPDTQVDEVEIARITIASTTSDVTCVYARRHGKQIHYRVVDEYEGETLTGAATRRSIRPLTLRGLLDLLLGSWDLLEVLDANFADHGYPEDEVHGFIVDASSSFYAEFGVAVHRRVARWLHAKHAAARAAEKAERATSSASHPTHPRGQASAGGVQFSPVHHGRLPDLQNLPEDPAIRPMLIGNGVPRHLWPEGFISDAQARALIEKHGKRCDRGTSR